MVYIRKLMAVVLVVILGIIIANSTAIQNSFGIYSADVEAKLVALNYDDGPQAPYTDKIIEILDRYQAKATFFCIGKKIATYPELVKSYHQRGHELANHSYSHQYLVWRAPRFVRQEIETTDQLLRSLGASNSYLISTQT